MAAQPNFFLVGAARSGTTSLVRYLNQHPDIFMTDEKEVNYFSAQYFPFHGPGDDEVNHRVIRDADTYARLFSGVTNEHAIGESSVFYLYFDDVPERIASAVPEARIIVQLREPSARAFSAHLYLARHERERLSFEDALQAEEERRQQQYEPLWWYKSLGLYSAQVKRYFDTFGRDRVKVLFYDDFVARPEAVFRDVFAFLGVDEHFAVDTSVRYNVSGVPVSRGLYSALFLRRRGGIVDHLHSLVPKRLRAQVGARTREALVRPGQMLPATQEWLSSYFADDIAQLEGLLGRDLNGWRTPSVFKEA